MFWTVLISCTIGNLKCKKQQFRTYCLLYSVDRVYCTVYIQEYSVDRVLYSIYSGVQYTSSILNSSYSGVQCRVQLLLQRDVERTPSSYSRTASRGRCRVGRRNRTRIQIIDRKKQELLDKKTRIKRQEDRKLEPQTKRIEYIERN